MYVFSIIVLSDIERIGADPVLSQPVNPVNMPATKLTDLSCYGWLVHCRNQPLEVLYLFGQYGKYAGTGADCKIIRLEQTRFIHLFKLQLASSAINLSRQR